MSDLFVEHRYFNFQNEIKFYQYNNVTLKHRDSENFRGCNRPISFSFKSGIILLAWQDFANVMVQYHFLPFSLTYLSRWVPNARYLVADDAFTSFSDNDR